MKIDDFLLHYCLGVMYNAGIRSDRIRDAYEQRLLSSPDTVIGEWQRADWMAIWAFMYYKGNWPAGEEWLARQIAAYQNKSRGLGLGRLSHYCNFLTNKGFDADFTGQIRTRVQKRVRQLRKQL